MKEGDLNLRAVRKRNMNEYDQNKYIYIQMIDRKIEIRRPQIIKYYEKLIFESFCM